MAGASIEEFAQAHLDELIALVAAEGWAEYAQDVERTAPGGAFRRCCRNAGRHDGAGRAHYCACRLDW